MKEQINENNYSAVALGFFDGIHQGHRAVIGKMIKVANEKSLTPIVYTFRKTRHCYLAEVLKLSLLMKKDRLFLRIWVSVKLLRMIS